MSVCYSCKQVLNKGNRSFEHIIPNYIGGVLKSARLICKECNSAYGMTIDAALAKDFENLAAFLNLIRDRPKPYIIKNTLAPNGDLYHLENGRNPVPAKPTWKFENGQLSISDRDKKEVMRTARGLKRRFPDIDLDSLERNFRDQDILLDHELKIDFSVGSDLFMRSVAKIAVNYYLMKVRGREHLDEIVDVINGKQANQNHIHYLPIPSNVWDEAEISHLIIVKGGKTSGRLYAHVVLFNTYSVAINLCERYDGDDIDLFYRYDIVHREEIKRKLQFVYNKSELVVKMQDYREEWNRELVSSVQENLGRILGIAEQRQASLSLREIIYKTLDKAIGEYPAGTVITQEILSNINDQVFLKINEFIQRNRKLEDLSR